jgi:hypothetical protein
METATAEHLSRNEKTENSKIASRTSRADAIEAILLSSRLLLNIEEPSDLRNDALLSVWMNALVPIPTEKLRDCWIVAMQLGPRRNVFGPWDLMSVWRDNLRGSDGKPVRGVGL